MASLKHTQRGAASLDAALLIATMAVAGVAGFRTLGIGAAETIRGPSAIHGAAPAALALSRQAGTLDPALRLIDALPERGSLVWDSYAHAIRKAFDPRAGVGYAVLPTERLFPATAGSALLKALPNGIHSDRYGMPLAEVTLGFGRWFQALIADALGRPVGASGSPDVRIAHEGTAFKKTWHHDQGDVVGTASLLGPGTEIVAPRARLQRRDLRRAPSVLAEDHPELWRTVDRGQLLVFAGNPVIQQRYGRAIAPLVDRRVPRGTHRSPTTDDPRVLLLSRVTHADAFRDPSAR